MKTNRILLSLVIGALIGAIVGFKVDSGTDVSAAISAFIATGDDGVFEARGVFADGETWPAPAQPTPPAPEGGRSAPRVGLCRCT